MSDSTPRSALPPSSVVALWGARVAWLCVAIVGGPAIGEALTDHSRAVQLVGTFGAWIAWAAGAGALAVASVPTLTLARAVVPGSLVVGAAALLGGADAGSAIGLVAPAAVATALVGSADFGRVYIQASAYGDEVRFGLRPPIGYLAASGISWLVTAAAVTVAPLAWAARGWPWAVLATVVAAGGLVLLPRRWHQLSRRWLVMVPAGIVVHDPVVLADTLMLLARNVASVDLDDRAVAARRAADLTGPTPGLAVEITLVEPATAVLAATRRVPNGTAIHLSALVVSPTRPGAVIRSAR